MGPPITKHNKLNMVPKQLFFLLFLAVISSFLELCMICCYRGRGVINRKKTEESWMIDTMEKLPFRHSTQYFITEYSTFISTFAGLINVSMSTHLGV